MPAGKPSQTITEVNAEMSARTVALSAKTIRVTLVIFSNHLSHLKLRADAEKLANAVGGLWLNLPRTAGSEPVRRSRWVGSSTVHREHVTSTLLIVKQSSEWIQKRVKIRLSTQTRWSYIPTEAYMIKVVARAHMTLTLQGLW